MFDNFLKSDFYALAKLTILSAISLFTIVQLAREVSSLRNTLQFQTEPITDRCIPLFRRAEKVKDESPDTMMLYDYREGTVDLRVCSMGLSRQAIIDIINQDPIDLLNTALDDEDVSCTRQQFAQQSTTSANAPLSNVSLVLAMSPAPDAWTWQYAVSKPDSQSGPCSLFFRYMNNPACPANATAVVPFRRTNKAILLLNAFTLAVSVTIVLTQTIFFFGCRFKEKTEEEEHLVQAFIDQGLVAGLHMLYRVFIKDEAVEESQDVPYVWPAGGFYFWFLSIEDLLGIISQAVSIYGCAVSSFAGPFALIILKSVKLVYTIVAAALKARRNSVSSA